VGISFAYRAPPTYDAPEADTSIDIQPTATAAQESNGVAVRVSETQERIQQQEQHIAQLQHELQALKAAMATLVTSSGHATLGAATPDATAEADEAQQQMANNLSNQGMIHHTRGEYDTAVQIYRLALSVGDGLVNKGAPQVVASRAITQANLGFALLNAGRATEASQYLQATLALARATKDAPMFIQAAANHLRPSVADPCINQSDVLSTVHAAGPAKVMRRLREFLQTFKPADLACSLPPTVPASETFLDKLREAIAATYPLQSAHSYTASPLLAITAGSRVTAAGMCATAAAPTTSSRNRAYVRLVAPSHHTNTPTHRRLRARLESRVVNARAAVITASSTTPTTQVQADSRTVDDLLAFVEGGSGSALRARAKRSRGGKARKNKAATSKQSSS